MAGTADSCEAAASALQIVGELRISARAVNKLAAEIGGQLAQQRDSRTRQYVEQSLPRVAKQVVPAVELAGVLCDGGRIRTRTEGRGRGVHEPHWRETKNAAFHRMKSTTHEQDPQPELPECLRNQAYVEKLVLGLKKAKDPQPELISGTRADAALPEIATATELIEWQPKTLMRSCISSLCNSEQFGKQMAAEADARGFFTAAKRAFLGDGQSYNWTIQRCWFPTFTPIADFIHVVEYVFEAAKVLEPGLTARWQRYVDWATACWQGNVDQVIAELGLALANTAAAQTIEVIGRTRTYLTNNRSRMDYPHYRLEGMPVTSSLAESLVKQISKRVKGTEKFWNDGSTGEAILQVRAAIVCQDDRLAQFIKSRPISPYSPRCQIPSLETAA